jgi:hypothetical protein
VASSLWAVGRASVVAAAVSASDMRVWLSENAPMMSKPRAMASTKFADSLRPAVPFLSRRAVSIAYVATCAYSRLYFEYVRSRVAGEAKNDSTSSARIT